MRKYHINVFWSDADKCWVADVPDLRTCAAFGDTPEEAVAEVKEAMTAWLEVAREQGHAIPEPAYRPAIYAVYSVGEDAVAYRESGAATGRHDVFVVRHAGGWAVKRGGVGRASGVFETQRRAAEYARQVVRNTGGGEVHIQGRAGKWRDSETVGAAKNSNPPRDRKR